MKKKMLPVIILFVAVSLVGCSEDDNLSGSSSNTIKHYCEASDCSKEGTKNIIGFSGESEYYCQEHYNEMQKMITKMYEGD